MTAPTPPKPPQHLAELLELIESGVLSEARQTREMACAIRTFGRWTRAPLDRLPTAPASLRRHLARLDYHAIGVSKGYFGNVKSLLNRALQLAGVKPANRPIAEVLTPAWRRLFERLHDHPYLRTGLAPFARFCAASDIEPNCVSDEVAQRYLDHLEKVSLTKNPRTSHQTVSRLWDRAAATVEGWPQTPLAVPVYAQRWTLKLSDFPTTLQQEMDAYLRRLGCDEPGDLLDDTAPIRPLKPSSIKTKRYEIRQFASALVISGVPIQEISSLAVLTSPENFRNALRVLITRPRKDMDKTKTAGQIAHTIRSIAKYHLPLSGQDLVVINNITRKLNVSTPGMTDKNRERLAQFRDESVLQQFLTYPSTELERLFRVGVQTRSKALEVSLLIAWEVNIFAPMRIGNLAALQLDLHIRLPRQSGGEAVILIPGAQVKNRQPLYYHLPPRSTELLVLYIERIRPMLEPEASDYLFPVRGKPKRADTLSKQLKHLAFERAGV